MAPELRKRGIGGVFPLGQTWPSAAGDSAEDPIQRCTNPCDAPAWVATDVTRALDDSRPGVGRIARDRATTSRRSSRSLFHEAGLLPGTHLRSLDALHLATALHVDADTLVAYDTRLLEAARSLGLGTHSPRERETPAH